MGWLEFLGGIVSLIIARWFYKDLKGNQDVTDPRYINGWGGVIMFALFGLILIFMAI